MKIPNKYSERTFTATKAATKKILQSAFLEAVKNKKIPVAIYLTSGIKLQGIIREHDEQTIMIGGGTEQLIYKHSISTIVPETNRSSDVVY